MSCVDEKIIEETNKILEKYKKEKDNLIPILNDIQVKFGYIPKRDVYKRQAQNFRIAYYL